MDERGEREIAPVHNIGAVTITTPGNRQIVVTRLFDAPRPVVFEAWTKAELHLSVISVRSRQDRQKQHKD